MQGLAEQLDLHFSQGQPYLLGRHIKISELLNSASQRWQRLLTIELPYRLEGRHINCELLLLFTEGSLPVLRNKIAYLLE